MSEKERERVHQEGKCDGHGREEAINDGGWQQVTRKHKGHWKEINAWRKRGGKEATTFFISNIPVGVTSQTLWQTFSQHGKVVDVVVPFRKSKMGTSFGFVRIVGIGNAEEAIARMGKVVIENCIVGVSLPKFDRNGKKIRQPERKEGNAQPISVEHKGGGESNVGWQEQIRTGTTHYKDVVLRRTVLGGMLDLRVSQARDVANLIGRSVFGKVKTLVALNYIEDWLNIMEVFNITVKYIEERWGYGGTCAGL
ncbi:hypothetical protein SSX86_031561 [Deinandra increscens subsp. villosa]|uniref:RRM domain-containing protein n=1 Tax=Deinandra increscens subsp. villosa TaxID=3103831 RepID=A0AAP0GIT2_9ASTR